MATITAALHERAHGIFTYLWETIGIADTGTAVVPPVGYDLESVAVFGTVGGATVTLEGSNMSSPTSASWQAIGSATTEGVIKPDAQCRHYRVVTSGGTGTDLDAYALFRQRT